MRRISSSLTAALLLLLPLASPAADHPVADPVEVSGAVAGDGPWVLRAYGWTDETVEELAGWFDHLGVYGEKGMLLVHADTREDYQRLLAAGLLVEVDAERTRTLRLLEQARERGLAIDSIPGFDCYRTVEETLATGASIAADHPTLAEWIDIGDSWQKLNPGIAPGWDIMNLKLTNQAVGGDKPALLVTGSNHAREYTTAELVTRFAELLIDRYGSDPDVTWLLDHHEIHLVLVMNPDGRKQAETGDGNARKNRNNNFCANSSLRGIDMNRNFDWFWGNSVCNGSSTNPCSLAFHGPGAESEPEAQAIGGLMRSVFPDQRLDDFVSAAPLDSEGIYLDIHSFGEVVLTSWGCHATIGPPPNETGIRTLARKYAFFPGYDDRLGSLGTVDGSTKDYSYGRLGVPGYTIELGTSFFEGCTYFRSRILEPNLEALLHTAKNVRTPYVTPLGPDTLDPAVAAAPVAVGSSTLLTATVDDTRYNTVAVPTQSIAEAEVYVDVPPWSGGTAQALSASDGTFDETVEPVEGLISTTGLAPGRHTLFVRGRDAAGNFGAVSAEFLYVVDPGLSPTVQGTVTDAETGLPLAATVALGPLTVATNPGDGTYSIQVPAGTYDVRATAAGHAGAVEPELVLVDLATETLDFQLSPRSALFDDDVEGGNAGWTAQPPWAITSSASNSPSSSWTDSPAGNYGPSQDVSLTSPLFDLSDAAGTVLSFHHIFDFEPGFDGGWVEASSDGGASWTSVAVFAEANQTAVWTQVELPLPMLDGSSQARVRFRLRSDSNTQRDGWFVDDILLEAGSAGRLFADGFESGNLTAWSASTP